MRTVDLVVSVGTDHHRFDRLAAWTNSWLEANPGVSCVYQRGPSAAPPDVESFDVLPRAQMLDHMRSARVVLVQAAPGSIKTAHEAGHRPIVVPRRHRLGEHVDDHQVDFAGLMHRLELGWVAQDEASLHELLGRAMADPSMVAWSSTTGHLDETVANFSTLVDDVMGRPAARLKLSRVPAAVRAAWSSLRRVEAAGTNSMAG